jgi:hypothetical protein
VTTGYTYRYVEGGADTYVIPDAEYDPGTDGPNTDGCNSTITGGSSNRQSWQYTLDAQSCEPSSIDVFLDGGSASSVADCYSQISDSLCAGEGGLAGVPSAPRNIRALFGTSAATVLWDAPTSDGGSAIIDYQVETSLDGGGVPIDLPGDIGQPVVVWGNGSARVRVWTQSETPPAGWTFELESQQSTNNGTTWTGV